MCRPRRCARCETGAGMRNPAKHGELRACTTRAVNVQRALRPTLPGLEIETIVSQRLTLANHSEDHMANNQQPDGTLPSESNELGQREGSKPGGSGQAIAALLGKVRDYVRLNPPTQGDKDEHAISWVLGNLNASTNHQTTREAVAAQYYKLEQEKLQAEVEQLRRDDEASHRLCCELAAKLGREKAIADTLRQLS